MREFAVDESATFRWHLLELLVHACWILGGGLLIYPFAAGLYFGQNPESSGFWHSAITGPVLSAPIFLAGIFINYCYKRLNITINSDGIKWTTMLRTHELRWDEINFIAESPKHFFSLLVDTKTKRWTIPLTGLAGLIRLRKMIYERDLPPPIELVFNQSRRWRFAKFLLIFFAIILLISMVNGLQIKFWSPPFDKGHLRFLGTLIYVPVIFSILIITSHLPSLSTSLNIVDEDMVYRSGFKKTIRVPLDKITSLCFVENPDERKTELIISAKTLQIKIQENFPNLRVIAKELSRRTGVEVREPNEAIA
jgi:hypothetical protein